MHQLPDKRAGAIRRLIARCLVYLAILASLLAMFVLGTCEWSTGTSQIYRFLYLARFPLAVSAILVGLAFSRNGPARALLGGLLIVNRKQLVTSAFFLTLLLLGISKILRTLVNLGPLRFRDLEASLGPMVNFVLSMLQPIGWTPDGAWLQLLLLAPLLTALVWILPVVPGLLGSGAVGQSRAAFSPGKERLIRLLLVAATVATTLMVVGRIIAQVEVTADRWLASPPELASRLECLGSGYFMEEVVWVTGSSSSAEGNGGKVHTVKPWSGHIQVTAALVVTLGVYISGYRLLHPANRWPGLVWLRDEVVPPLCYVLLLLNLAVFGLTGLSFLLDYWRMSVLVWIAMLSYCAYRWLLFDHFFQTFPLAPAAGLTGLPKERQVREAAVPAGVGISRPSRRSEESSTGGDTGSSGSGQAGGNGTKSAGSGVEGAATTPRGRKLVVFTAYGGGILAGAWCTRAMTSLFEWRPALRRMTRLVSSVSGGSVGTLFMIDALLGRSMTDPDPDPQSEAMELSNERVRKSSLEATVWGLVYPGLIRLLIPAAVWDPLYDNGWAMEQRWKGELRSPDRTLAECMEAAANGDCPVVIMNAVCVETGQRFLLSSDRFQNRQKGSKRAFDFFGEYPQRDLALVTAARISASFPFVSPISRIDSYRRPVQPGEGSEAGQGSPAYEWTDRPFPDWHFADGGYADNFGVSSAIEWLREHLGNEEAGTSTELQGVDRILLVRICSRAHAPVMSGLRSGWKNQLFGPLSAVMQVRSASQAERVELELDLMRSWCESQFGIDFATSTLELDYGGPLSWQLSPTDLAVLDAEWSLYEQALHGHEPREYPREDYGQIAAPDRETYWADRKRKIKEQAAVLRSFLDDIQTAEPNQPRA